MKITSNGLTTEVAPSTNLLDSFPILINQLFFLSKTQASIVEVPKIFIGFAILLFWYFVDYLSSYIFFVNLC